MNATLREKLGKAALDEWRAKGANLPPWEEMPEEARDHFGAMAEAVIHQFATLFVPVLINILSWDEIKRLLKSLE